MKRPRSRRRAGSREQRPDERDSTCGDRNKVEPCRSLASSPPTPDLVTSVFSTPIAFQAWFATAAAILAIVQVLTGARIFGKLQGFIPVARRRQTRSTAGRAPRGSRRFPVAFHPSSSSASRPRTPVSSPTRCSGRSSTASLLSSSGTSTPRPSALARAARRRDAVHGPRALWSTSSLGTSPRFSSGSREAPSDSAGWSVRSHRRDVRRRAKPTARC